jgi:hypothetical protein
MVVTLGGSVRRVVLGALAIATLMAASSAALAAPAGTPKVYLLRGFMNVFSLGLDELSAKIERRGIRSEVYNHTSWSRLAGEIANEYKSGKTRPVVIIGHSMGGNSLVDLLGALDKAGIPVALAITLEATAQPVNSARVGTLLNMYASNGAFTAGRGFKGKLVNMDLGKKDPSVGHFSIDKVESVHNIILRHVASAVGRGGAPKPPASANAPQTPASRS